MTRRFPILFLHYGATCVCTFRYLGLRNANAKSYNMEIAQFQVKTARKRSSFVVGEAPPKDCAKLVARNVAFEATERELRDVFKTFGELKSVRLPKKVIIVWEVREVFLMFGIVPVDYF